MVWLAVLVVIVAAGIYFIFAYNRLVFLDNITKNAWSQIEINIKLRNDLLPLLAGIVGSYSEYEKTALKELTSLRAKNKPLTEFFASLENYPHLKADKSFLKLQEEISRLESNIGFKRQFYNDAVYKHNTFLMSFPSSIAGKIFGFKAKKSFENDSEYGGVKL